MLIHNFTSRLVIQRSGSESIASGSLSRRPCLKRRLFIPVATIIKHLFLCWFKMDFPRYTGRCCYDNSISEKSIIFEGVSHWTDLDSHHFFLANNSVFTIYHFLKRQEYLLYRIPIRPRLHHISDQSTDRLLSCLFRLESNSIEWERNRWSTWYYSVLFLINSL